MRVQRKQWKICGEKNFKNINWFCFKSFWRLLTDYHYVRGAGVFVVSLALAFSHLSNFKSELLHLRCVIKTPI